MLCPETWDFKAPEHHFAYERASYRSVEQVPTVISPHYFNHSVSIVLPDANQVPKSIRDSLVNDTEYYKISELRAEEIVNKEFIEAFVKKGELTLLTINKQINVKNSLAVCPSGHLILSLVREDYQKLGIEGSPSFFDRKKPSRYGKSRPAS